MRPAVRRLGQERSRHVGVPARRKHGGATKSIRVLSKPVTLMRQRSTVRAWEAFDDKAERLTSNVSIDGFDEADHRARLTRSPQGTIRVHF